MQSPAYQEQQQSNRFICSIQSQKRFEWKKQKKKVFMGRDEKKEKREIWTENSQVLFFFFCFLFFRITEAIVRILIRTTIFGQSLQFFQISEIVFQMEIKKNNVFSPSKSLPFTACIESLYFVLCLLFEFKNYFFFFSLFDLHFRRQWHMTADF